MKSSQKKWEPRKGGGREREEEKVNKCGLERGKRREKILRK